MALSPIDVQQKTFRQAFKGYDGGEVDEFLDDVVVSLRQQEEQLREAEDRIAVLEDQLRNRLDSDDSIKRAFLSAQKAADQLVDNAKLEADGILARAREEATALTDEQASEKARLLAELDALRETTHDLAERLRAAAARDAESMEALAGEVDQATSRFVPGDETEGGGDQPSAGVDRWSRSTPLDDLETGESGVVPTAAPIQVDTGHVDTGHVDTGRFDAGEADVQAESDTAEWQYDEGATEEVPTLRRPWERGTD